MKSILKIQKDGVNTLKEEILKHSNNKLKKIYIVASDVKESGYEIIEECLIDLKARKFVALGIDKKNTTRKMLDNILKYTKNVYIWDNNNEIELNANIYAFEYDKEAYVYMLQGSITDSMLVTDLSIYNTTIYDLDNDKKEYTEFVETLTKLIKTDFVKLEKEYIEELVEKKLIFTTKQYMHVVPSIAELLGKTEKIEEEKSVESPKLPKINLDNEDLTSFEIDLGDVSDISLDIPEEKEQEEPYIENIETEAFGLDEEVLNMMETEEYVVSDEAIDMESMVLDSKVVRLDKVDIKRNRKKQTEKIKDTQTSKKIVLSKVSNIIMELGKKPIKGKDIDKLKVPNYIKDMIPEFFEVMEDATLVKNEEGEFKQAKINLEIIDVNTSNKYTDSIATIKQKVGQTYIEFVSDKLSDIAYEEMDIVRIIKLSKDSFHIEIIPQGIEEYNLWDKLCTNSFRGSNRQYGLM